MNHYLKKLKLTSRQREIIVGTLLGDAHLETQTHGRTYRLRIMHSAGQKEYVEWLYNELKNLVTGPVKSKIISVKGKTYSCYWFDTMSSSSLRFYAQQFYPQGKKRVPRFVSRLLTPLGLAVWFMDDGSIKSHETRGKILNTQGFLKQDVELLIDCLSKRFNIESRLRKQKEGWQIFIPAAMYDRLVTTTGTYILPSMKYKLE